jgi:hypothetical protein
VIKHTHCKTSVAAMHVHENTRSDVMVDNGAHADIELRSSSSSDTNI